GDVNGDGRPDILEKNGWWEQPPRDAQGAVATQWTFHPVPFAEAGGSQMMVHDLDGDGDADVITSKAAHAYGLAWFEQLRDGKKILFREHMIMGERPDQNDYGIVFTQLHALTLSDMNRDGVPDIVTGKRFWAHNGHDPGERDPAVSYWFETVRDPDGLRFVPHVIDDNSGVGTQVVAGDLNHDEWPDLIVGNKMGAFALIHQVRSVNQETWRQWLPPRFRGDARGATPLETETDGPRPNPATNSTLDEYPHAGLTADEAVRVMQLPPGFSAEVFAEEPDVTQPIAFAVDDRGRVWVAEAHAYPRRAAGDQGPDRIVILEESDQDGGAVRSVVFAEGLNLVSGLELGFGGVWIGAAPHLLFIPDRDQDDHPDGPPEVVLDGWGYEDTHETLNTFTWGPDGWLYGCHGVFTHSRVGVPGTEEALRVPLNAGIWRYHPTRKIFEVFAEGTSNPWGLDFNDHGQAFCTACVIPHLFHVIQGARYTRQAGQHFDPHTYADIPTIADHLHFLGDTPHAGNGRSHDVGGGHAHCGAMIYLGGAWPAEYRDQIFMNNVHGQRINLDVLRRRGSGYLASHGPDFLLTGDRASQMLNFQYGPDGQVFVIDWYDMNACHHTDVAGHDRSNGRVYRVKYDGSRWSTRPRASLSHAPVGAGNG
ncbi:MAG TPA: PVC-type heme-binding CxxCH protein, partial [Pirellulaceae bacterium]